MRLNAVAFADNGLGYTVGAEGTVLRTDDGGRSWQRLETMTKNNFYAVSAINRADCLIVGGNGQMLSSDTGGRSWKLLTAETNNSLFAVASRGGTNTWIAGAGGMILKRSKSNPATGIILFNTKF